jgi:hypothetical protein
MFKINVKKSNFMLVTSKEDGKLTYLGYLPLIDLIKEQKRLGKNLFTGNVRGALYKPTKSGGIPKPYYKDSLFNSIYKTITDIQKTPENKIDFFNNNQGSLIMADSFDDSGVLTFKNSSHGVGNGQQTISICSLLSNSIPISKEIILPVKICVGYSDEENNSMCQSNNTSKSMTKKSFTSKDWEHLINPLKSIGYTLLNKYQKNPTKGEFVINIHNEPFLNVLSSHVSKKPWIKGSEKISSDVLDILNLKTNDVIFAFELNKDIDRWIKENKPYLEKNKHILDTTRKGGVKNIIATLYKDNEKFIKKINMSDDEFYKLCFDDVIESGNEIGYKYFNKDRISNHILSIGNKLKDIIICEFV